MPRQPKKKMKFKEMRKEGRYFSPAEQRQDRQLDSEEESGEDYVPEDDVTEQYRLSTERLRDIVDEVDDKEFEGFTESGYRLIYKENPVTAIQKAHQSGGCEGCLVVQEDSKHIKGFDGCMTFSCSSCAFTHRLFNSEPSAAKPNISVDSKNLNARMVMVALETGNGSPLFKVLVQMLGLPCKFSKSTWCSHITKFKELYEDVAEQVLDDSRGKVSEVVEVDDNTGLTPLKIGYDGTWAKRGYKLLFGAGFAVALQTNEIIDFGTKSKLNESVAFAPFPKNSEKFKEHKAKVEASSEAVFTESSGAMEKEICKDIFSKSKDLGFQYTDLLGDGDSKAHNEIKDTYGICKKYEEKTGEEKEEFDVSTKGIKFWQKHREKKLDCKRVNKIECINHVDKRCGAALRDV